MRPNSVTPQWQYVVLADLPEDLRSEFLGGVRAAAAGAFLPRFYRVKRRERDRKYRWRTVEKRYRRPGKASLVTRAEARAIQAFWLFQGDCMSAIARRFHRHNNTIAKVIRDPEFRAVLEGCRSA